MNRVGAGSLWPCGGIYWPADCSPLADVHTVRSEKSAPVAEGILGIEDAFSYEQPGKPRGRVVEFVQACLAELGVPTKRSTISTYIGLARRYRRQLTPAWFQGRPFG